MSSIETYPQSGGGTDLIKGTGKVSSTTTTHQTTILVDITGRGILTGVTPNGTSSHSFIIEIDGGTTFYAIYPTTAGASMNIPFKKSLKVTCNNPGHVLYYLE
jgi:hypothetical protein